ncbi:MAG: Ni/Fe hydrogenase subunit alpha [Pseudomonadota bacterium]
MQKTITIEPITRIEGHGKISIRFSEAGQVEDASLAVTQFRGFEKICQGRPFYEMPLLVERICGICPVSHAMASSLACDQILGVRVPRTAVMLRQAINCAEFIQSHALSFFYLSAPDLLLGSDSDPGQRNLLGLLAAHPVFMRDGIRLRQIGQTIIEKLAGKRIHPSWIVPGGVASPLSEDNRAFIASLLPDALAIVQRTLAWFRHAVEKFEDELRTTANFPSLFMGLVSSEGNLAHLYGRLRVIESDGTVIGDQLDPSSYQRLIAERTEAETYLKSPYYKPLGYPEGIYRVGPAARLNVCNGCGTPLADQEWAAFRDLESGPVLSGFLNHHARLIEILFCIESLQTLLADEEITGHRVLSRALPNFSDGIGVVEAPRGTLIHHYRVDTNGLITWVNMIVATGHNSLAMNRGLLQAARRFIDEPRISEATANRLQAVIRSFDPCLSCATHALGPSGFAIELLNAGGTVIGHYPPGGAEDQLTRERRLK